MDEEGSNQQGRRDENRKVFWYEVIKQGDDHCCFFHAGVIEVKERRVVVLTAPVISTTTHIDMFKRFILLLLSVLGSYNCGVDGKRLQKNTVVNTLTFKDPLIEREVERKSEESFCFYDNTKSNYSIMEFSHAFSITLVAINEERIEFPWHSVSILSTDDFHNIVQSALGRLWGIETPEMDLYDQDTTSHLHNWLRDIVSSCPSPLVSSNRSQCSMTFSPYGKACVNLRTSDKSMKIRATFHRKFEVRYIYALVLGISTLWMAHECSKSKLFQYVIGSIGFLIGGLFILGLMGGRQMVISQSRNDRHKQWWSSSMTTTGMSCSM